MKPPPPAAGRGPTSGAPDSVRPPRVPPLESRWALPLVIAVLGLFVAVRYSSLFAAPFHGDDFVFLAKTRSASFAALWSTTHATFGYLRPWSRELHYWLHQRVFGADELAFHLSSVALWLAAMGCYFALARRIAGPTAAAIATAGVAALTSWAVLLTWIAGVQDLWMLALGLGSLLAMSRGRVALATALFGLALLSKETAIAVPFVALAYLWIVEGRSARSALLRTVPLWGIAMVWAGVHPRLGGGLFAAPSVAAVDAPTTNLGTVVARTMLAAVDLDQWPRPNAGWGPALQTVLDAMLVLVGLVALAAWTRRRAGRDRPRELRTTLRFAVAWTLAGLLPLLAPSIGWQAYYGLFAVLGLWLILGAWLALRPWLAVPAIAAMVLLSGARTFTPSREWGSPWYQNRASNFVRGTRDYFKQTRPTLEPHSRVFLSDVPNDVGLIAGERSPVLQVWYGDTTLTASFASSYRPRTASEPAGPDLFFAYDTLSGWRTKGITLDPAAPTMTEDEREAYATEIFNTGRYREAAEEFTKLSKLRPDRYDWIFNVGTCHLRLGDSTEAARWYVRAAEFPEAPAGMKRVGEKYLRFLRH